MSTSILSQLLEKIQDPKTIQKWKENAAKSLYAFTKKTNPFKLKPSRYYLYIDTRSLTYGLVLQGVKPNAGAVRGFGAPVDRRFPLQTPVEVETRWGWKTVKTGRSTSGRSGVKTLETQYFGISGTPTQFYGLRRGKTVEAFGLIGEQPVPIYSDTGLVEWITEDNLDYLEQLLENAGFTAIEFREK